MSEQTFQKFKLAIEAFNDYLVSIQESEEYKTVMEKYEAGEIDSKGLSRVADTMFRQKFESIPEQFTEEELIEIYNNFAELVAKTSSNSLNQFNTLFVPFIENKYPQFFLNFWNNHNPMSREYDFTRLFYFTKQHLTEKRVEELLLMYKKDSNPYSISYLLGDITITNRIINYIFENNIDVYLENDLYNSMIAQISDLSFDEKIVLLQKRSHDENSYAMLFSTILSIVPENYTLAQILEEPFVKEKLKTGVDYENLLRCYKFKSVDEFLIQLNELNLIEKIDVYGFESILANQHFNKDELIKIFSSKKIPYSLKEIIDHNFGYQLYIFRNYSLTEVLEILNNKEIFPHEIEESLIRNLVNDKLSQDNIDEIISNPLLCRVFFTNFSTYLYKLQEDMKFRDNFKAYGISSDEMASKLLKVFNKENFTMALSQIPSTRFSLDEKYERFLQLANEIPNLMTSFNFTIFRDDIFELGYDFAKLMSLYSSLSSYFTLKFEDTTHISSGVNFPIAFPKIWQTIEQECQKYDLDKKEILSKILSDFSISTFDFSGIETADVSKLIYYIQRYLFADNNLRPKVSNFSGLANYELNLAEICDEQYSKATTLEEKMNIYFNKYFNMSRIEAINFSNLYLASQKQIPGEIMDYVSRITTALNIKSIDVLDRIYATEKMFTLKETYIIEKKLKQFYSSSLRKGIDENNPLNSPTTNVEFGGKTLKIHHPIENFCMLVHSTDAYGKLELLNDNYYDSWNKSSRIRNHGICCSYVAQDNLGIAEVRDVLLGFTGWDDGAMPNMAPYDLYTANDDAVIDAMHPNIFLTYRDLINNTRHTHNEISLERYQDIPSAKHGKIQPSYIIIFEDMPEELKQKAYKAAMEFGQDEPLPIICLDKKLIAERECQKIDIMIEEFRRTGSIEVLAEILCKHENNRSGYRITNPEFLEGENAFFSSSKIVNLIEETIDYYMTGWQAGNISIEDYWRITSNILEVLDAEEEKFNVTNETGHRLHNIDLPVREWRSKIMESLSPVVNMPLSKAKVIQQFIFSEDRDDEVFKNFAAADIEKNISLLNLIKTQGVYGELGKNHDLSHIERVLLFADLLAKKENLSERERELLLVSAAYHDCGRENDRVDANHGERSATKIAPLLETFTAEEQGIIKTAIEFHEEDLDFILSNLCMKYNLSQEAVEVAKKIANLLKDADALDRTRFRNAATLDPKRLRTASAKGMVEFAKKLQKLYRDLPTYLIEQTLNNEMHYTNR